MHLRRMELQGILRGGRFVTGIGGEQFSLPDTVEAIRRFRRTNETKIGKSFFSLTAADPLNLLNLISRDQKLSRLQKNRVLYQGGNPIAVLESGQVRKIKNTDSVSTWDISQMLTNRNFRFRRLKASSLIRID